MNIVASNILSRKMHNFFGRCITLILVLALPMAYFSRGHETFMGNLDSIVTLFGVWGSMGAAIAYLLLRSPLVRFTDSHVIVERNKSTEKILWEDILSCRVIPQSGYSPADPVRLRIKGRILGLSFSANSDARAVLEEKFGKLRWGL